MALRIAFLRGFKVFGVFLHPPHRVWKFQRSKWYPTLMLASPTERADYHITHYAAHWPHLDYDLGANAIICGHKESAFFSQQAWKKYNAKVSSGESLAA